MDDIERLVADAVDGDPVAAAALVRATQSDVWRLCAALGDPQSADDLTQETYLRAFGALHRFEGRSSLRTWLLAIARYKALSALRRRTDEHLDDNMAATIEDTADNPEIVAHTKDRNTIVQKCLTQLSPAHREVIDLVYYHEKSVKEVAQIVGVPESTVKTRMFYARKRMETMLETAGVNRQ